MPWIVPPVVGLIEPIAAPVIWVDGVGAIAVADGVLTTYYCTCRDPLYGAVPEHHLEVILKRPLRQIFECQAYMSKVMDFLAASPATGGWTPRVVG